MNPDPQKWSFPVEDLNSPDMACGKTIFTDFNEGKTLYGRQELQELHATVNQ